MELIIGREKEKALLNEIYSSKNAEFTAIFGRRRIGKTHLIKNFYKAKPCILFHITGIKGAKMSLQLEQFVKILSTTFYHGASIKTPKNWMGAFEELTTAIQNFMQKKKIILFFDEFPWLASKRSGLIQTLDYFWNRFWVDIPNVKLIVCGSASSWIINKLIRNKGGLHNRITRKIALKPFSLHETELFLDACKIKLNRTQITQIYMALGGIPYYLKQIRKGKTAAQNINTLCFNKEGLLFSEFDEVFSSLFEESEVYKELIVLINSTREGVSRKQIEKSTVKGGRLTQRLKDLENTGFISEFIPLGHKHRGAYYKVVDEYCCFYLTWIQPAKSTLLKEESGDTEYWQMKVGIPKYNSWSGYAFEAVCYKHISNIRKALGINYQAEVGSWRYSSRLGKQGAQIDLLFDRYDGSITICEIKYTERPFVIDKAYRQNLLDKVAIYKRETKTKKQIFFAIISASGIAITAYSQELISNIVVLDDLYST